MYESFKTESRSLMQKNLELINKKIVKMISVKLLELCVIILIDRNKKKFVEIIMLHTRNLSILYLISKTVKKAVLVSAGHSY